MGAPFTLRIGARPLIARLRQHVVPPQPPQLFSIIGFRVHPPTPLKGGFLALCFPSQPCRNCAFRSKTELKWITVGLWVLAACAGRSTKSKVPNKHFASRTLSGLLESRAKQDDFSRRGWWPCANAKARTAGRQTLFPHRSDGTLGASAGASSAHANGQRRSRQFRVEG